MSLCIGALRRADPFILRGKTIRAFPIGVNSLVNSESERHFVMGFWETNRPGSRTVASILGQVCNDRNGLFTNPGIFIVFRGLRPSMFMHEMLAKDR